jgi:hypothetical protein
MELFKNIRLKIGRSILRNRISSLRRKFNYSSFQQAKKIAIVWDASNISDFVHLTRFQQQMQDRKISVEIFGYYPGKELPDQLTALRYLTVIKRKELDFFYIPVSSVANDFIKKDFDILIDINFKKIFPLTYISSMSKSGLKVGLLESKPVDSPFDLMIELKSPVGIENYLIQAIQYLEMINNEKPKTTK